MCLVQSAHTSQYRRPGQPYFVLARHEYGSTVRLKPVRYGEYGQCGEYGQYGEYAQVAKLQKDHILSFKKIKSPRIPAVATCLHQGCGVMAACTKVQ